MATNAQNVEVGVTGAVFRAPLGSKIPTDATTSLDAAFKELGYVSEDGVTQTINADIENIKAWQNGDIVRVVQTSHELTYQLTLIETNDLTSEVYYGSAPDAKGTINVTGAQMPEAVFVFEMKDGDKTTRVAVPRGRITDRGDVVWKTGEAVAYEITVSCMPDANGAKAVVYRDVKKAIEIK